MRNITVGLPTFFFQRVMAANQGILKRNKSIMSFSIHIFSGYSSSVQGYPPAGPPIAK